MVEQVDPLHWPHCSGQMKVIAFITNYGAVDRIIAHFNLTFVAERHILTDFFQQLNKLPKLAII